MTYTCLSYAKKKIEQRIRVEYTYDIYFTRDIFSPENPVLKDVLGDRRHRILAFVDSGVAEAWPGIEHRLGEWFNTHPECGCMVSPAILVPAGEQCKKDLVHLKVIARNIRVTKLDRHSVVIIVGGGAVLDAVGFIASITHRGIRHIRIPTTVLSQNDSGVGVKNGINLYGAKNYFGSFAPPYGVINDLNFLKTLKLRDWLAGISEAFKVAIIKDRSFLMDLVSNAKMLYQRNEGAMEQLVRRCAQIHAEHIATCGDPFEFGTARPLDFGHWSAHYLEVLTDYELRHGEAVAIGIVLDMIIARNRGLINQEEYELVRQGLEDCGFSLWHPMLDKKDKNNSLCLNNGLEEFRQHLGGRLTLIMPVHLGESCQINTISHEEIERAVLEMKNRYKSSLITSN
ncbi:MAG: 3-dehydroquinate synthase [bacterium]